jgi:hypothetical protein
MSGGDHSVQGTQEGAWGEFFGEPRTVGIGDLYIFPILNTPHAKVKRQET